MQKLILLLPCCLIVQTLIGQEHLKALQKKPFILGETLEIESSILAEKRILNIYLPEGYNKDDTINYPVIYLLEGAADEDFIHIVGLVQFCNFPWVNILPKSIVVGIANVDRRRDFTYPTAIEKDKKDFPTTGGSGKFITFIEKELQPFIEQQYKTNSSKTLIGQSFGGLLATEILFNHSKLFNKYIIISPSLWWGKESLLAKDPNFTSLREKIEVYIAVGKEGKIMERDAKKLYQLLNKNLDLRTHFQYFPDKDHATIYHQAVYQAFEKLDSSEGEH
ncbi:MAG: alpha/beta hydrolase-fold protein [Saprospiraceae bacterium]|nr:alpha/beta hydrolase-fold protein [Saprospiraceae bacterium]